MLIIVSDVFYYSFMFNSLMQVKIFDKGIDGCNYNIVVSFKLILKD